MKKVRFDIGWRLYNLIVGFIVVALALGVVYAYGGSDPSVHGHDAGELNLTGVVSMLSKQSKKRDIDPY